MVSMPYHDTLSFRPSLASHWVINPLQLACPTSEIYLKEQYDKKKIVIGSGANNAMKLILIGMWYDY